MQKVGPSTAKKQNGLLGDIEELNETLKRYPWTALSLMRGDAKVLQKLDETEKLLKDLRKALAQ